MKHTLIAAICGLMLLGTMAFAGDTAQKDGHQKDGCHQKACCQKDGCHQKDCCQKDGAKKDCCQKDCCKSRCCQKSCCQKDDGGKTDDGGKKDCCQKSGRGWNHRHVQKGLGKHVQK